MVKRGAVGVSVCFRMVEMTMDGGIKSASPFGEFLHIFVASHYPSHLYHVAEALADKATVDMQYRFAFDIYSFGG